MHEEIDEGEFYHEDFTTATDWEILLAHLEDLLTGWQREKRPQSTWTVRKEQLPYSDTTVELTWCSSALLDEGESVQDDFPVDGWQCEHSCLARWYRLNEFVVLSGLVNGESEVKLLLGAITVISGHSPMDVPMFVQKMHEEIDEGEFYHEDFTTATDWEILLAHLEDLLTGWQREKRPQSTWTVRKEQLPYSDTTVELTWCSRTLLDEGESVQDDFPVDGWQCEHSCLARWYRLNEFVVLSGLVNGESELKLLLGAITVISGHSPMDVPMFVQVNRPWQRMYCGVYQTVHFRTHYDVVHLKRGPAHCQRLGGLLELYKSKVGSPSLGAVSVSCRLTFVLRNFREEWSSEPPTDFKLPFGAAFEPITGITLETVWNRLPEHAVVDGDFEPLRAPKWLCNAQLGPDMIRSPICLLSECLSEFLQLVPLQGGVLEVLGEFPSSLPENPSDFPPEPAGISRFLPRISTNKPSGTVPPLPGNQLVDFLYFLFPDADENGTFPYPSRTVPEQSGNLATNKMAEAALRNVKTCAEDSLVWRLAVALAQAQRVGGGARATCRLWHEFVQELRYRWQHGVAIPGLTSGMPDLRTCLLNQKLQLLNCCIERKAQTRDSASDASDDEFYDAVDDDVTPRRSTSERASGRLSRYGDAKLLRTGQPLYVPVTQDPVPKTEDQLEEDTDVLLKLGTDSEASELRARIMSASLLSDMESFKAANPGACLEDFIRWYSPRDWLETDESDEFGQKKGTLSPRMLVGGNIWVEMWENALPVAAANQKRLFDDTREAEKVLQYLELLSVGQMAELIVPVLSHAALKRLIDETSRLTVDVLTETSRMTRMCKTVERTSRDATFKPNILEQYVDDVGAVELRLSQLYSLQYKFNPTGESSIDGDIWRLAQGETIEIVGKQDSPIGSKLIAMFMDAQLDYQDRTAVTFPGPDEREFVMRADCARPRAASVKCPQMMRAILRRDQFRLVGAFSEDVTFY